MDLLDGRRRLEAAATGNGARLVVLGGFATSDKEVPRLEITREILEFDPFASTWRKLDVEAPEAWTHAQLVGIGGALYLMGGMDTEAFVPNGKTYRLRPSTTTWEALAPLPAGQERGSAAVVTTQGHIFLFGGITPAGATGSVLDYIITENRWAELPALPIPRSHAAAMRMDDGTFIVAGGDGSQLEPLGDTWALPLGATLWEPRDPMPTARGGCAYGEVYGKLVCAGGEIGPTTTRVVEAFDPSTLRWESLPDMPFERAGAPGAVVTSRLYVVGGSQTRMFEPTSSLLSFDLLDTVPR